MDFLAYKDSHKSRESFALTYYSSSQPLYGVRCVRCDSLRFSTLHYTKERKFLFLNPKKIIPAKVHVRLGISICNIFPCFSRPRGRLPCKFESNRSITAILRSVFLESCRKISKNPFFQCFLAQN